MRKYKRDRDRNIKPGYNVEFGLPPTLDGSQSPPIEDFTILLFHKQSLLKELAPTLLD